MADLYPLKVEISEADVNKLLRIYKIAQYNIQRELLTATDFGVYNRSVLLAQIDVIIRELAKQTGETVNQIIPKYYEKGANQANSQLRNIGAPIDVINGFNSIHQEAITALVSDTSRAFGETLTGVKRHLDVLLGKYVREQITQKMAEGMMGGKALNEVKKGIKSTIAEQGIVTLKDKGGKSWSLDRYSEMLFRTKTVEARNRGLINRMVEYDYDLVQVSDHAGECQMCSPWEGRILSISGKTKGYPTVAEAESVGLFHPNCRHAINTIIPSLAKLTNAYYPDEKTRVISKAEIEKATKLNKPNLPAI